MAPKVVPMIHVPDVRAAADWYQAIGFTINHTYADDGDGLSFAILSFGSGEVMFNQGGEPSASRRREVDLYVYTDDVDGLHDRLADRVVVVEAPHDTFYGMRELIIRDLNGFWVTFGQAGGFQQLLDAVRDNDVDAARRALGRGGLSPAALRKARAAAPADSAVEALLAAAGVPAPPELTAEQLGAHAGRYRGDSGLELAVAVQEGALVAGLGDRQSLRLIAIDDDGLAFAPIDYDDAFGTLTFTVAGGATTGCALASGGSTIGLARVG
jgi:uncharacterized glyoxalase superfamily protein PhnB